MLTIKGEILKNVDYQTVLSPIDFFNNIYIYMSYYGCQWDLKLSGYKLLHFKLSKINLIHEIN